LKRGLGIGVVGEIPLGTHFCQFYKTKQDLVDILVPYFAQGLENGEYCMWITSPPLEAEEAWKALRGAVERLDHYAHKGQIEVLDYKDWYTKTGRFNAKAVLQGWVRKERQALKRGFKGLRLTGNTFWLERREWRRFCDYEATVNGIIGKHRMIALCSYSLNKCKASDMVDVVNTHQFALIRREGEWHLVGGTEYTSTLKALRQSEERYRTLFETTGTAMIVIEGDMTISLANREFEKLSGYSKEDVEGKKQWTEFVAKEDLERMLEYHRQRRINPESAPGSYMFQGIDKNGNVRDILITISMIPGTGKSIASLQDITPMKQAEKELWESQERYRTLVENLNDAIFSIDAEGYITYVSPVIEKITGYEAGEVTGKPFSSFVHADDIPGLKASYERTLAGKLEPYEFRIYNKQSGILWVRTYSRPSLTDGKPLGITGILSDITERRKMEEQLNEASQLNQNVIDNMNDWLDTLDENGNVIIWNKAAEEISGYSKEEVVGHDKVWKWIYPDERYRSEVWAKLKSLIQKEGVVERLQVTIQAKNGQTKVLSLSTRRLSDKYGRFAGYINLARDITERKRFESELKKYSEHLEELVKERTEEIQALNQSIIKRLTQKIAQIEQISEVREKIRRYPDVSAGLNLILESGLDGLGMDVGAVFTINRKENVANLRTLKSKIEGVNLSESIPLDRGLIELEAVKTGQRGSKVVGENEASILQTTSVHYAPIMFAEGVQGLLIFGSRKEEVLDNSDLAILTFYSELVSTLFETRSITVTPTKEAKVGERIFKLEKGTAYLMKNEVEKAFEVFADNVLSGTDGLCITREYPPKVRKRYGLEKTPMVWLTDEGCEGEITVRSLQDLSITINDFLERTGESLILLDGIEYLITNDGFESFLHFLQLNRSRVEIKGSILLAPLQEEAIDPKQVRLIEREMKAFSPPLT